MPETSTQEALFVAERIRSSVLAAKISNPGASVAPIVTLIGIASRSQDQSWTPDEIQWEADTALYQAKEQGRNRVIIFLRRETHRQASIAH